MFESFDAAASRLYDVYLAEAGSPCDVHAWVHAWTCRPDEDTVTTEGGRVLGEVLETDYSGHIHVFASIVEVRLPLPLPLSEEAKDLEDALFD